MLSPALRTFLLAALALMAFAGNSILTRLALAQPTIGAVDFAGIRLLSGALMLALIGWRNPGALLPRGQGWPGVLALFIYTIAFTLAYIELSAAAGALILFGAVQLTLVALAIRRGATPSGLELLGVALAFAGLLWLLAPGASAPSLWGALLMIVAGVAFGFYTAVGRGASDPFILTAANFIGAAPLGLAVMLVAPHPLWTAQGIALAIASGAITSGLGYVLWYAAQPGLSVATAGAAQLLVPVIAAAGGVIWIGEAPSPRLLIGGFVVLSGMALTILARQPRN